MLLTDYIYVGQDGTDAVCHGVDALNTETQEVGKVAAFSSCF